MKSAKSRRFGPPKKTLTAKGLALSENFGLRRLVLEDCVRHHPHPAAPRYRRQAPPQTAIHLAKRRELPAAFSCTCCPAASTASATTACSPARFERTTSSAFANCSPPPRSRQSARLPRSTARPKRLRLRASVHVAAAGRRPRGLTPASARSAARQICLRPDLASRLTPTWGRTTGGAGRRGRRAAGR